MKQSGVKPVGDYVADTPAFEELPDRVVAEPLAGLSPVEITKDVAFEMLEKIFR